jgi:hypothetical protein
VHAKPAMQVRLSSCSLLSVLQHSTVILIPKFLHRLYLSIFLQMLVIRFAIKGILCC